MNLSSERTNYASIICKSQRIIPFPLTCRRLFTIYESPVGLWTEHREELYESYPRDFIDYAVINGIRFPANLPYELFLPGIDAQACEAYIRRALSLRPELTQARKQLTRLLDEIEYDLT